MSDFSDLRAWHERIVAANPGEVFAEIPVRERGEIVGSAPAYLPAWMRCEERERFLAEVDRIRAELENAEPRRFVGLVALNSIPGVPHLPVAFVAPEQVSAPEPRPTPVPVAQQAPRAPVELPSFAPTDKTRRAIFVCLTWRMMEAHPDHAVIAARFLTNDIFALLTEHKMTVSDIIEYRPDLSDALADIVALRAFGVITAKHAKDILAAVWTMPYLDVADHIVASGMLEEAEGGALLAIVQKVINDNPKVIEQIRSGKAQAVGFLVGQVMKAARGKADPSTVQQIIKENIG